MAHQTAVDIIRVISEAVNPTGQFAYLRTWDASLEFNEVDQKIFLYPISGQVDITNGYFETWTCSMGFFFQDAPDSTNEQREQLITNADVLLKAFILAADTVDGVQFSIVRKRPVYRDMAGTYSGYLVDFTLSLTEDICNGDTPSVIIPVGKTFCELVDECLGISVSGDEDLVLNQKGEWVQGGGGAVDSVNGKTGVVVLDADDIAETATRFWLTNILKSAYDTAVTWISNNGANLLNHLTNTSNPHSTTAAQVGAPSGSGTSTGTNTGDQDLSSLQEKRIVVSTNTTAVLDGAYTLVASATFTDPSPSEGKGYSVFIRNGTATIGGTPYSTVGTMIWRVFHSGAWATYVLTNQTQLDAKQNALGYTPEDVANKQTDLTASATKYPTVDAVNTGLGTKQDTLISATNIKTVNGNSILGSGDLVVSNNLISRKGSASSALTGTTVETILESVFVASGVVSVEDIIEIKNRVFRATGTSQFTIRYRINSTNSISGSLLLGSAVVPNGSFRSQGIERTINFRSGNTIEVIDKTNSHGYENATTTQPNSSSSFTYSSGFWLLITGQLNNAADNLVNSNYIIQKF